MTWRLAAGVLPAVIAVGLLIGLFYYGKFGRTAPRMILAIASALTIASIVAAWLNASYFAERITRLARAAAQTSGVREPTDEFDRIEQAVGSLGSALSASEAERARHDAMLAARLHEQATMLAGAVSDSVSQLDQVRLPLQILLESPFGDLNDNQEELLRDARAAADAIDLALRRLGQLADADRDALHAHPEPVQLNDVVRSVLPIARAAAERNGGRLDATLEPGLPRVLADRSRLAEALALLATDLAATVGPEHPLTLVTRRDGAFARIDLAADGTAPDAAAKPFSASARVLAARLVAAAGGNMQDHAHVITVDLGISGASR